MKKLRIVLLAFLTGIVSLNAQFDKMLKSQKKVFYDVEKNSLKPSEKANKDLILRQIDSYLDAYETIYSKHLSPEAFSKIIRPFFAKAIGNSDGIVKNGSALSYALDKDKSTIAINHAIYPKKFGNQILNLNFNGTSDGSFLNTVNSTKYNYGIEGSAKLSSMISSSVFRPLDSAGELKKAREKQLYYTLMAKYKQILNTDTNKLKILIENIDTLVTKEHVLKSSYPIQAKDFKKLSDSLNVLQDSLKTVLDFYKLYAKDELKESIIDQITSFDKENAKINGYSMGWLDYGLSYKLLNNAIFDSTIYKFYKVSQKQFHRMTFALAYNYFRNTQHGIFYFSIGSKIFNGYALENQTLANVNIIDTTGIQEYSFKAYNNLQNKNLNTTYLVTNPFITMFYFPFKSKEFGLETSFEGKFHDYSAPVYDGRIGFLYSVIDKEDKDKSRTTVGVFLTLNKYDSSSPKLEDYLGVGFRVGFPFSNFLNEKK